MFRSSRISFFWPAHKEIKLLSQWLQSRTKSKPSALETRIWSMPLNSEKNRIFSIKRVKRLNHCAAEPQSSNRKNRLNHRDTEDTEKTKIGTVQRNCVIRTKISELVVQRHREKQELRKTKNDFQLICQQARFSLCSL